MRKQELELYIHIPFCVKKCAYCDFLSFAADEKTQRDYVKALGKELEHFGKEYADRQISTIFFGGGTPSWLQEDLFEELMEAVYANFAVSKEAEISVECNPGTVTDKKFEVYQRMGVNRLSIGLQSANDEELRILGRIHTFEQFLRTYEKARIHGFKNINVDLMSSLPGQTPEKFAESLKKVIRLKPEHISAYSLIIEEGTPFYQQYGEDALRQDEGKPTEFLPSEEEESRTVKLTRDLLQAEGYHWYEISNFAKPGKTCRHNIGYWKRADYLGVGLGAASLINEVRYANTEDLYEYMKNPLNGRSAEHLSRNARMEEFLFLGLRMIEGISREEFCRAFGVEIEGVYGETLKKLQREGLLQQEAGRIFLTEKGIDVSNYVLAQFLLEA